jgi:hypothetical protein
MGDSMKTLVQFTRIWKQGRRVTRREPAWISAVSWADGPGHRVTKIKTTTDLSKAFGFSLVAAHDVAIQYYTHMVVLTDEAGVVKPEATAALYKDQTIALANRAQVRAEFNRQMNDMFPPELQALIRKAMQS